EQRPENKRRREKRQNRWQIEDDAIDRDLWQVLVHRQGQDHGDDDANGNREPSEVNGVPEDFPEQRFLKHSSVVRPPNVLGVANAGIARETQLNRIENRINDERDEADEPGPDEDHGREEFSS